MFDILFGWRKASKCKKLIKRVQCRLKLLKNKRFCIVKQLREDVAELLKHGHDQSAFERVEQLIMDESMIEVYDLLYQFCEFIIINLPYIRKHRDCPNDINEAASTLVFSSARFGELPELLSIRKLFGERYSERFVTTALELLPGNLVSNQIKENIYMKKVPDAVKYRFLDEIARSCIQTGPLLLEYKPELQEDEVIMDLLSENQKIWKESCFDHVGEKWIDEIESSSQTSTKLPEEVIYLDDIEEFASPVIKNGNLQDQRLFMFRSFGVASNEKTDYGIDQKQKQSQEKSLSRSSRKTRRASRKRSRRRSLSQENRNVTDIECAIYYGELDETSPDITRKSHYQKKHRNKILVQQNGKRDHDWELSCRCSSSGDIVKKCSLEHPCYFYTRDRNEAMEMKDFSIRCLNKDNGAVKRAVTMPSERPKESSLTDNVNRSNSFPCSHIHPKLPDYDELAAKFMELKRVNIQKQNSSNLQI